MFDALVQSTHRGALRAGAAGSLSRWVRSSASWSSASVGSSLARLGVKASRYRASVSGLRGKRTRKSYLRRAETEISLVESRQTAMGWPLNRSAQRADPRVDGLGRVLEDESTRVLWAPAAWRHTSCLASAQSMPTKAANASCDQLCVMRHLPACERVAKRDMRADVLRRHYREPVARQTLSIR